MKRTTIILFMLLLGAAAKAQLLLGPKIGAQAVLMNYDKNKEYSDSVKTTVIPGFSLGAMVNVWINNPFSLQFEANYSLKGRSIKGVYDPYLNHQERNHYLEVPALLRYSRGNKYRSFYVNAGPNLSYWLGGSGRILTSHLQNAGVKEYPYSITFKENNDGYDKVLIQESNRLQIGLDFGAGMLIPVQNGRKIMVEVRYSEGHSYMGKANSVKNNIPDYPDNLEASSRVLNLSFAYVIEHHIHGWKKGKSVSK